MQVTKKVYNMQELWMTMSAIPECGVALGSIAGVFVIEVVVELVLLLVVHFWFRFHKAMFLRG